VFCGPSMVFTNVINPRSHIERKREYKQTLVKRGATIGANAVLVCGVEVGSYSMIGAGAVVTRDVPDYALVVGNPARRIGWTCQCGVRLESSDVPICCRACGSSYEIADGCCRRVG
jgi:UDP-2-acetamido-3-amino-2,3-dideoxy-glucuronate N-acetyltransferase